MESGEETTRLTFSKGIESQDVGFTLYRDRTAT